MSVAHAKGRKSRSKRIVLVPRTCVNCRQPFTPARADSVFCQTACRIANWNEHAHDGRIMSARRVKSGEWSIVVRMKSDIGLVPGQTVRIGEP